jgi:hypothetical protein
MLKTVSTTLLLVVLFPIYTLAYVISYALKLKDRDLMESPLDFVTMSIDAYLNDTYEIRYMKKLVKEIELFYSNTSFIPAPSIIDLFDRDCVKRVADDIALFGKDAQELHNKVIEYL